MAPRKPALDLTAPAVTFVAVLGTNAEMRIGTACYVRATLVGAVPLAESLAGMVRVARWLGHDPEVRTIPAARFASEFGSVWPLHLRDLTAT